MGKIVFFVNFAQYFRFAPKNKYVLNSHCQNITVNTCQRMWTSTQSQPQNYVYTRLEHQHYSLAQWQPHHHGLSQVKEHQYKNNK